MITAKSSFFDNIIFGKNDEVRYIRLISLAFSVCMMAGIMYYYNRSLLSLAGFTLLSIVIQCGLYALFDYINEHKLIGTLLYILISAAIIAGAGFCISLQQYYGNETKGISVPFSYWFLTPQSAMPYFKFYTYAILLVFNLFIASAVYYFTVVRYRIFISFLLFMIPLTLYAKELADIPILFIILGFCLFFCITLLNPEKSGVRAIYSSDYGKTAGLFLAVVTVLTLVIPKVHIDADRDSIENMIKAASLTEKLMGTLNKFESKSNGGNFYNLSNNTHELYHIYADESLNLKARVFDTYNYDDNSWEVEDALSNSMTLAKTAAGYNEYERPELLVKAYNLAYKNDKEFAGEYNWGYMDNEERIDSEKTVRINAVDFSAQFLILPSGFIELKDINAYDVGITGSGEAKLYNGGYFSANSSYGWSYSSEEDGIMATEKLMEHLNIENYFRFLNDLGNSLNNLTGEDAEYYARMSNLRKTDFFDATRYYKDTYGSIPEDIKELAEDITVGMSSDYSKAVAIQDYFIDNGYAYDLEYKNTGNVENFLFESKTGVCYEYATAMTLLARAAGLPARYVEGFSASVYSKDKGCFVVTQKESHAFPEVYISGYGWLGFEPTVPSNETASNTAQNKLAGFIGLFMLIILFVSLIIAVFVFPRIVEILFRLRIKRLNNGKGAIKVFLKLKKMMNQEEYVTTNEMAEIIYKRFGVDFSISAEILDKYIYGNIEIDNNQADIIYKQYLTLYDFIKHEKSKRKKSGSINADMLKG